MNVALIAAGALAVLAAAIHGAGGEVWVVRKLSPDVLPPTRFGGSNMTSLMIHVTWHITTVAFLTAGVALLLAGSALEGDAARAIALVAAGAWTGFAAVATGLAVAQTQHLARTLRRHPGPVLMALTATLAWVGALS